MNHKNIPQLLFIWSKKSHRWAMWLAIITGAFMSLSGIVMENAMEGERKWLTSMFNIRQVRTLHATFGNWLVLSLFVMIVTGLVMWGYPLWVKFKTKAQKLNKA